MKKLLIPAVFLMLLTLAACTSQIVKSGGVLEPGTPAPTADIETAYKDEILVYITKTGAKYHSENCRHLSESKIPVSLEQALKQNKEPCSVCDPPR